MAGIGSLTGFWPLPYQWWTQCSCRSSPTAGRNSTVIKIIMLKMTMIMIIIKILMMMKMILIMMKVILIMMMMKITMMKITMLKKTLLMKIIKSLFFL